MSIEIRVGDAYVISSDKYQFILHQIKEKGLESKNPGEETRALVGFYPDIRQLVTSMMRNEMLQSSACDLQELQWLIEETAEKCQGAFNHLATQAAVNGIETVFPPSVKPLSTSKGGWAKLKAEAAPKLTEDLLSRLVALPLMDEEECLALLADIHVWAFPPEIAAAPPAPQPEEEDDEL